MSCGATRLGVICPSLKGAGHEHYGEHPLGIARWWDTESGIRVNSKRGDGGQAVKVFAIDVGSLGLMPAYEAAR